MRKFKYYINLTSQLDKISALNTTTDILEISINSHVFTNVEQCLISCEYIMKQLLKRVNTNKEQYILGIESPDFTEDSSNSWEEDEIGRIWIYEKHTFTPIARARILLSEDISTNSH